MNRVMLMALAIAVAGACAAAEESIKCVKQPPEGKGFYVPNREPLAQSRLMKLPIGAITPRGFLRNMLELEARGQSGRLTELSKWCNAEGNAWADPKGQGHSGWEELPYWLKGYGDLGYVLKDEKIIKEAKKWIDVILQSQEADGWFGPRGLKTSLKGKPDLWPNMLILNVLQSWHEVTGDARVLPFMANYFKWELNCPEADFMTGYWPKVRTTDNLESIYWLYNRTGEKWLLDVAAKVHKHDAGWARDIINWHNVNIAQAFREPTVWWLQAKDQESHDGAERNYQKVMGTYGQFPGGGFVADENARPGYTDPRGGFETCGIVEFMHSFEMLTRITGNPLWADRCEDIAYNSFPASMMPDLKGLHYLTCPNQIQLDAKNKAPAVQNGGNMFSYSPHHYRCCQHNVAHGWPYFAEECWLATGDNGLCASLYTSSEVTAKVGDGSEVKIVEETDYPFSETMSFRISAAKAVNFPLYLRVPQWCSSPKVKINGQDVAAKAEPLAFIVIDRQWRDGDTVSLRLPMSLRVRTWEKNNKAASVDFGPLSFSLRIGENWKRCGGTDEWPEMEVYPTTPWNYGLSLDTQDATKSLEVVRKSGVLAKQPFTPDAVPIQIKAKGRKIPGWVQEPSGIVGKLKPSPVKSEEPEDAITLIPMGAARLRISMFPVIGPGADANDWGKAKPAGEIVPTASHCHDGDSVEAMCDGLLPKNSNDHDIPRMTWWPHKGTAEWVQYDFAKPRRIKSAGVYWFDDSPKGGCRVPASWQVTYKDGEQWKPVRPAGECGVKADKLNEVTFDEIETKSIRVQVQLKATFSGGILEWKAQ